MALHPVAQSVQRVLQQHSPTGTCVVGCSMGADSTALLLAVHSLGTHTVHAVYVDHGLRPESVEEGRTFLAWTQALGVTGHVKRVDLTGKKSLQAAARKARYAALEQVALEQKAACVLVAHNQDDQAETFLLRLFGGAGSAGLGCMQVARPLSASSNVLLVRPLLGVNRESIIAYLQTQQASWCEDPSNQLQHYARNWIRHTCSPLFQKRYPRWRQRISAVTVQLQQDAAALDQWASGALSLARKPDNTLDTAYLATLPPSVQVRVLRQWVAPALLNQNQLQALIALCAGTNGSETLVLLPHLCVTRCYTTMTLHPPATEQAQDTVVIDGPGEFHWKDWKLTVCDPNTMTITNRAFSAVLNVEFPLTIRSRQPGDRIALPRQTGHRKVSDVLIDAKVPRLVRDHIPLLCDLEGILWIVGIAPPTQRPASHTTPLQFHFTHGVSFD